MFDRPAPCPTADDSMVIYNNSLSVYSFYENNKSYRKLNFWYIKTPADRIDIFAKMKSVKDEYAKMIKRNSDYIKANNLLTGLSDLPFAQYYNEVDAWRFYQRELEYKIVNDEAPFPLYDSRISPITVTIYKNVDNRSEFFNDEVNIPMYIPVTVKPYMLLTEAEKIQRAEILSKVESVKNRIEFEKKLIYVTKKPTPVVAPIAIDTIQRVYTIPAPPKPRPIPSGAIPVYYFNSWGAGTFMGHMIGRKFRKYQPGDEFYEFLPSKLKELYANDELVKSILLDYYGAYFDGFYE